VQEITSALARGDVDQMSFAFWPVRTRQATIDR